MVWFWFGFLIFVFFAVELFFFLSFFGGQKKMPVAVVVHFPGCVGFRERQGAAGARAKKRRKQKIPFLSILLFLYSLMVAKAESKQRE